MTHEIIQQNIQHISKSYIQHIYSTRYSRIRVKAFNQTINAKPRVRWTVKEIYMYFNLPSHENLKNHATMMFNEDENAWVWGFVSQEQFMELSLNRNHFPSLGYVF